MTTRAPGGTDLGFSIRGFGLLLLSRSCLERSLRRRVYYKDSAVHFSYTLYTSTTTSLDLFRNSPSPPPPPALARGPPSPPPAPATPEPLANPESSGYGDRVPLSNVFGDSGEVYMVVELPNTAELVVLNSDDEPIEEELQEDLEV